MSPPLTPPPGPSLVVLAAGLGTRYGGLKQLDPMGPGGSALLDFALADAKEAGFAGGVVVVREEIREVVAIHLDRTVAGRFPVELVCQRLDDLPGGRRPPPGRDRPWGTAHAVWAARAAVEGAFAVANADDHYGPEAYRALAAHLAGEGPRGAWGLAGYRLGDVLSTHGPVNRGLCELDEDGWLVDVVEARGLVRTPDGGIEGRTRERGEVRLGGDETVSTNLWAFTDGAMSQLEEGLADFLEARGDAPDSECTLPDLVRGSLLQRRCRVRVYQVGGGYFGVTSPEDRSGVVARLAGRGDPWEGV